MALPTRKKQAKKPNALPVEFLNSMRKLFDDQFEEQRKDSEFLVYADLYSNEVVFCASLTNASSLRAGSLYISADLAPNISEKPEKVTEQLKSMVDVAASWFAQGFEKSKGLEAILAEIDEASGKWEQFEWEGQDLYAKLNRDNHALEHVADKFLRDAGIDPADEEVTDEELEELLEEIEDDRGPPKKLH